MVEEKISDIQKLEVSDFNRMGGYICVPSAISKFLSPNAYAVFNTIYSSSKMNMCDRVIGIKKMALSKWTGLTRRAVYLAIEELIKFSCIKVINDYNKKSKLFSCEIKWENILYISEVVCDLDYNGVEMFREYINKNSFIPSELYSNSEINKIKSNHQLSKNNPESFVSAKNAHIEEDENKNDAILHTCETSKLENVANLHTLSDGDIKNDAKMHTSLNDENKNVSNLHTSEKNDAKMHTYENTTSENDAKMHTYEEGVIKNDAILHTCEENVSNLHTYENLEAENDSNLHTSDNNNSKIPLKCYLVGKESELKSGEYAIKFDKSEVSICLRPTDSEASLFDAMFASGVFDNNVRIFTNNAKMHTCAPSNSENNAKMHTFFDLNSENDAILHTYEKNSAILHHFLDEFQNFYNHVCKFATFYDCDEKNDSNLHTYAKKCCKNAQQYNIYLSKESKVKEVRGENENSNENGNEECDVMEDKFFSRKKENIETEKIKDKEEDKKENIIKNDDDYSSVEKINNNIEVEKKEEEKNKIKNNIKESKDDNSSVEKNINNNNNFEGKEENKIKNNKEARDDYSSVEKINNNNSENEDGSFSVEKINNNKPEGNEPESPVEIKEKKRSSFIDMFYSGEFGQRTTEELFPEESEEEKENKKLMKEYNSWPSYLQFWDPEKYMEDPKPQFDENLSFYPAYNERFEKYKIKTVSSPSVFGFEQKYKNNEMYANFWNKINLQTQRAKMEPFEFRDIVYNDVEKTQSQKFLREIWNQLVDDAKEECEYRQIEWNENMINGHKIDVSAFANMLVRTYQDMREDVGFTLTLSDAVSIFNFDIVEGEGDEYEKVCEMAVVNSENLFNIDVVFDIKKQKRKRSIHNTGMLNFAYVEAIDDYVKEHGENAYENMSEAEEAIYKYKIVLDQLEKEGRIRKGQFLMEKALMLEAIERTKKMMIEGKFIDLTVEDFRVVSKLKPDEYQRVRIRRDNLDADKLIEWNDAHGQDWSVIETDIKGREVYGNYENKW